MIEFRGRKGRDKITISNIKTKYNVKIQKKK